MVRMLYESIGNTLAVNLFHILIFAEESTVEKAIVLTKFIPAPAFSGGAIRSRAWIRFLSKYYDIILLGYWDKKFESTRADELTDYTEEIFGFDFVRSKKSLVKTGISAVMKNQAVVLQQYYSVEIQNKINDILANQDIKLIFCEELSTMQYVKNVNNIRVVFDDHNIEYELQERAAKNSAFYLKPILKREAYCVKQFEMFSWEKADLNYFVSDRDRNIALQSSNDKKFDVVENTFSSKGILNRASSEWFFKPTCVFVGNLSWKPNHHGLVHFFENIYPRIKDRVTDFEMILLGSSVPDDLREYAEKTGTEIIENIEEETKINILSKCWLALVPVYFGSGTRIKILEYWAHAKTVLSTTIGAEGLHNCIGTFIKDSDEDIVNAIVELLNNKQRLEEYGRLNREVYKNYYEEEMVYADSLYYSLTAKLDE